MAHIVGVLESLATIIDTACYADQGHPVEVIRKESVSMLAPAAAARMLQLAYTAVIAIDPLPGPAPPIAVTAAQSPALFGGVPVMQSPWLMLALAAEVGSGPVSLSFKHGQRVSALPAQVRRCLATGSARTERLCPPCSACISTCSTTYLCPPCTARLSSPSTAASLPFQHSASPPSCVSALPAQRLTSQLHPAATCRGVSHQTKRTPQT